MEPKKTNQELNEPYDNRKQIRLYASLETETEVGQNLPLLDKKDINKLSDSDSIKQEISFCQTLKDIIYSLKMSLPSCFSIGDYMIVVLIIKSLTAYTMDLELTTSTGYLTTYYNVLLFAVGGGLNDSIGIYCAQAWGSKKPGDLNKMYLMYKQSILIIIVYFLVIITPLAFFFESFLYNIVGANPRVAEVSQKLVIYCLPALFIRSLTDLFKSYANAQEIIQELGYFTLINLAIVPFYSYLFINKLNLGSLAYGLCLFTYECGNIIIAVVVSKYYMIAECKTTTISISHKFGWFLCESAKNSATVLHIFLAYESVTLIISQLHDDAQLGAYTILVTLGEAIRLIAKGFSIYGRTEVNKFIGKD
jgi:MatE